VLLARLQGPGVRKYDFPQFEKPLHERAFEVVALTGRYLNRETRAAIEQLHGILNKEGG
jgi:hypothetical protein